MISKTTPAEISVLKRLYNLHEQFPKQGFGFHASWLGTNGATICRKMESMGLVEIDRQAVNCFRYALTDAGERELEAYESSHSTKF